MSAVLVERLCRKWVAVYPVHTFVLEVSEHQKNMTDPCVGLILAAPISEEGHSPDKTMIMILVNRILRRIIVNVTKSF